jgi:hypothetical protein
MCARYTYVANWALDITLQNINDGKIAFEVLDPKLDSNQPGFGKAANLHVERTALDNLAMTVPDRQEEKIKGEFETVLGRCLGDIKTDLATAFNSTSGQFIYPGNGDLVFSDPMISRFGNILAQVKHKP